MGLTGSERALVMAELSLLSSVNWRAGLGRKADPQRDRPRTGFDPKLLFFPEAGSIGWEPVSMEPPFTITRTAQQAYPDLHDDGTGGIPSNSE
jgi:hypothetical protein